MEVVCTASRQVAAGGLQWSLLARQKWRILSLLALQKREIGH
jgi:hypothetical protein